MIITNVSIYAVTNLNLIVFFENEHTCTKIALYSLLVIEELNHKGIIISSLHYKSKIEHNILIQVR